MPQNIVDVSTFMSPIIAPVDGDSAIVASVISSIQGLSNRTKFLDDRYKEGTWNPVLSSSLTNNWVPTGVPVGNYVRIGGMVLLQCRVQSIPNSSTGILFVTNIPYNPSVGGTARMIGSCNVATTLGSYSAHGLVLSGSSGEVQIYVCNGPGILSSLGTSINNVSTVTVEFSIAYPTTDPF